MDADSKTGNARTWWTGESVRWVIVTLLIPFVGFVWNDVERRRADRQGGLERVRLQAQQRLESARSESEIVIRLLPSLTSSDEASRGIALAILVNLAGKQALSPELVSSVQVAIDLAGRRIAEGTATTAEQAALTNLAATSYVATAGQVDERPSTGGATPAPAQQYRMQVPRVYIHIFDEADRALARQLQRWITSDQRWLAPAIENVVTTALRRNSRAPAGSRSGEVRYFSVDDRALADDVATQMRAAGVPSAAKPVNNTRVPAGQIEVWFPQRAG